MHRVIPCAKHSYKACYGNFEKQMGILGMLLIINLRYKLQGQYKSYFDQKIIQ